MLTIDLRGKRAFVAGVADDAGFGFAIAKHLAQAGASVCVGTWPPAYGIFTKLLQLGKIKESLQFSDGGELRFEHIYPLDAEFDTMDDVPQEIRDNRRYKEHADYSIQGVAGLVAKQFGDKPLDIVVHSLANGPEVKKPLIETSRKGYLAAVSASSYSFVSMVRSFAPLMRERGAFLNLSFMASERVIPGYGGGMSSAKAALESDTRTLAYEAGRLYGARVNSISAGAWASRAASAIGFIEKMIEYTKRNAPLPEAIVPEEVGATAAFLCSPLGSGITGSTIYVDKGFHTMGIAADAVSDGLSK
ncbi:MAG TPA: enoyl-[acyl-carrier-protein] reductase [Polyangiales bacterium]|nr:enoyl-[acyl-carrier-protein] reductase [Polyangiales bacterium]